jgi:NIMA (never in mitosis gene a)-related kinase
MPQLSVAPASASLQERGYHYKLDPKGEPQCLGSGAFAKVLLLENADGQMCVSKQVNVPQLKKADRALIDNEVAILQQIDHPHVMRCFDTFTDPEGVLHIVCEYAAGGDLCQRIQCQKAKGYPFAEATVMNWFVQLCQALDCLHQKRILHRDLKAENVLLTVAGAVKLADFGVSVQLQPGRKARTVVGTPYYYSPEMCEGLSYDEKSDVWSLGILLYEIITFSLPYYSEVPKEVMKQIMYGPKPTLPDTVSTALAEIVAALLTKDINKRPMISEVLAMSYVQNFVGSDPVGSPCVSPSPPKSPAAEEEEYEDDFENED